MSATRDAPAEDDGWRDACAADALRRPNSRLALCVDGRHIMLARLPRGDALVALDATCYHMGGPLLHAEIEEVGDGRGACLVCPWHRYHVSATTGERVYRDMEGRYVGIPRKQRVHEVCEDSSSGRIRVRLSRDPVEYESDRYAHKAPPPSARASGNVPTSGSVFQSRAGGLDAERARKEWGPLARTSGVRSMVAESMRGGDGVAPWAMGAAGRAEGSSINAFGSMNVRRPREANERHVTFAEEERMGRQDDGGIECEPD